MRANFFKYFNVEYWNSFFSRKGKAPFFRKVFRVLFAASRGFNYDDCFSKASFLTYYSLLSIVPTLAVAYGIAKGFGFEKHLELELREKFLEQTEVSNKLFEFAQKMLASSTGGLVGGVGVIALLWTVLKLLGNIESSFNAIWKVKQPRSFSRKFSDYLAIIIFCPIFFAASSSISVYVMTNVMQWTKSTEIVEFATPFISLIFHLTPLFFAWLLFTGLYYIMPNARVPLSYALIAGITAGTLYQIVQWIYIKFQFGLTSYNAVYGSFAAVPLFLIWINISWQIALAGAEIAYHIEIDRSRAKLFLATRQCLVDGRILGLLIMHHCIKAFSKGQMPPTEYVLSEELGVPVTEVRIFLQHLINGGFLVETGWKNGTSGYYQPGKSIELFSVKSVCDLLDSSREAKYAVVHHQDVDRFEKTLKEFDSILENDKANTKLV